jgi:hypothetical protein
MPWCEPCARFYNPNTVRPDGTCPTCNTRLAEPSTTTDEERKVPWHFWLLLIGVAVYLGWRLVQLVMLIV